MNNKNKLIKYILAILSVVVLTVVIECGYMFLFRNAQISKTFSIDRIFIFFLFSLLVGVHFVISYRKIWDFIYRKRYYIGVLLFVIIVARGYHGSSVFHYNNVIEPNYSITQNAPIIGEAKSIRSDEFLVDTPGILSQIKHNDNFQVTNDAIMAREGTTVYMFPQLPTKSISVLSNPKLLGFLFLPLEQAFSFYWYILFFVCFFATFEVGMVITKGKKLYSALGACLLTFSPAFLWWNQLSIFASGFSAILFIHLFIQTNNKWMKLLYSLLLGYAGCVYIMTLYPGWLLPFGYVFFGLCLWLIIDNRKKLKWKYLLYLIPSITVMTVILLPAFLGSRETMELMGQTVYPGARVATGGYGDHLLFNYFIAPFYTLFRNMGNACEASQFIGLYPIPIFASLYIIFQNFKKKKADVLLNILTIVLFLLLAWNYFELPLFAKITMLSISTPDRAQLVINVICILMIIRIIGVYEVKTCSLKKMSIAAIAAILMCTLGLYITHQTYPDYVVSRVVIVSIVVFIPIFTTFIINNKFGNKILTTILIGMSLFNLATVQPVSRGLAVMEDKPIAKEVEKLVEIDKEAKWVMINSGPTTIFGQNYLLANGARVINSTNQFPNLKLWQKIDLTGKYDEVYNRYAHIAIDLSQEETKFDLLQGDLFKAILKVSDFAKLDAKYVVSPDELSAYNTDEYIFEKLYQKDNLSIYKFNINK